MTHPNSTAYCVFTKGHSFWIGCHFFMVQLVILLLWYLLSSITPVYYSLFSFCWSITMKQLTVEIRVLVFKIFYRKGKSYFFLKIREGKQWQLMVNAIAPRLLTLCGFILIQFISTNYGFNKRAPCHSAAETLTLLHEKFSKSFDLISRSKLAGKVVRPEFLRLPLVRVSEISSIREETSQDHGFERKTSENHSGFHQGEL